MWGLFLPFLIAGTSSIDDGREVVIALKPSFLNPVSSQNLLLARQAVNLRSSARVEDARKASQRRGNPMVDFKDEKRSESSSNFLHPSLMTIVVGIKKRIEHTSAFLKRRHPSSVFGRDRSPKPNEISWFT